MSSSLKKVIHKIFFKKSTLLKHSIYALIMQCVKAVWKIRIKR